MYGTKNNVYLTFILKINSQTCIFGIQISIAAWTGEIKASVKKKFINLNIEEKML